MQSHKILATSFSSEKSNATTRNARKITIHPKTIYKKLSSQRDRIWVASVSDSYTDIHGCVGTYIEHYTANERFIYASIPYDWYIKRMIWVSFINALFEVCRDKSSNLCTIIIELKYIKCDFEPFKTTMSTNTFLWFKYARDPIRGLQHNQMYVLPI